MVRYTTYDVDIPQYVTVCMECGAVVMDRKKHDEFHEKINGNANSVDYKDRYLKLSKQLIDFVDEISAYNSDTGEDAIDNIKIAYNEIKTELDACSHRGD